MPNTINQSVLNKREAVVLLLTFQLAGQIASLVTVVASL